MTTEIKGRGRDVTRNGSIGMSGDDKSINGELFIIRRPGTAILALQNDYFDFS